MKKEILFATIMVSVALLTRAQDSKLTLKECIETALHNNITVQQSEVLAQNAEINYRQAKNNMLPTVQSSYNYSINNGRSIDNFTNTYINQQLKLSDASAQASLPLFNGFQLKNTIKQNEMAFAGAKMEWQQRKDELTLQVILAYLQVLSAKDAIGLANQQAALTKQQVDRIEIIGTEGATAPGNVSDLKGQYAGDRINSISAQNSFEAAVLTLTQLMLVPYSNQLQFDKEGLVESMQQFTTMPDEIYAMALQKLAMVKATDFRVASNVAAVKVAKANYYPSIALFGGASTNFSSSAQLNRLIGSTVINTGAYVENGSDKLPVLANQNHYESTPIGYASQFKNNIATGFGVSVRIPIFNSFRTRTAVKLAKNDEKYSRLVAGNVKQLLRQNIDLAYINITAVYKRHEALKEQANAYNESFRIAALRFEEGVINSPEYLIAKNNLDRANANLLIAQYEFLLRKKILEFYMGSQFMF